MKIASIAAAILVCIPHTMLAQNPSPSATVASFYTYDRTHSQVLSRPNIDARSKWLTPAFARELREEEIRERAESKLHPDEKPWFGDGLSMQPYEEYFKEHGVRCRLGSRITLKTQTSKSAVVSVRFAYVKPCEPNGETYKLRLTNIRGKWLINDIILPNGTSYRRNIRPS
jgi:hypothetical protein